MPPPPPPIQKSAFLLIGACLCLFLRPWHRWWLVEIKDKQQKSQPPRLKIQIGLKGNWWQLILWDWRRKAGEGHPPPAGIGCRCDPSGSGRINGPAARPVPLWVRFASSGTWRVGRSSATRSPGWRCWPRVSASTSLDFTAPGSAPRASPSPTCWAWSRTCRRGNSPAGIRARVCHRRAPGRSRRVQAAGSVGSRSREAPCHWASASCAAWRRSSPRGRPASCRDTCRCCRPAPTATTCRTWRPRETYTPVRNGPVHVWFTLKKRTVAKQTANILFLIIKRKSRPNCSLLVGLVRPFSVLFVYAALEQMSWYRWWRWLFCPIDEECLSDRNESKSSGNSQKRKKRRHRWGRRGLLSIFEIQMPSIK